MRLYTISIKHALCLPRLDFLATYAAENIDGNLICRTMKQMLDCEVGMIKDLEGKEVRDP